MNSPARFTAVILAIALAIFAGGSVERSLGATVIISPALFAVLSWLNRKDGVPIVAAFGGISVVYYCGPILTGELFLDNYSDDDIFIACLCVSLFLTCAVIMSELLAHCFRKTPSKRNFYALKNFLGEGDATLPAVIGLALGLIYRMASIVNPLSFFGSFETIVRAVCMASAVLGAFLLGGSTPRRSTNMPLWLIGVLLTLLYVFFSITSFLLIYGALTIAAAMAGYVYVAARPPLMFAGIALVLLMVFNAGKYDMRDKYWAYGTSWNYSASLAGTPELIGEWFVAGTERIFSGTSQRSLGERATLLNIVLRVRALSPDLLPFLDGKTFAMAPANVIPRILNESKGTFHDGTILLGIYYGIQSEASISTTSIAIGLIAEAWANFGYGGLVLVGSVIGVISGFFEGISFGKNPVSIQSFMAFTVALNFFNLENDSGTLAALLPQSFAACLFFYGMIRLTQNMYATKEPSRRPAAIKIR